MASSLRNHLQAPSSLCIITSTPALCLSKQGLQALLRTMDRGAIVSLPYVVTVTWPVTRRGSEHSLSQSGRDGPS